MRLSQSLCRLDFGFFNVVDIKSMFFFIKFADHWIRTQVSEFTSLTTVPPPLPAGFWKIE